MKPLRERNQATVGAVTLVLIVLVSLTAFNADRLPLIGGGTTYEAYFTEAAGLVSGNQVQVAGVKVGQIDDVTLAGNKAKVDFTVHDTWVGAQSTISIQIKTVLGEKYLSIAPKGRKPQPPNDSIPADRTVTPFDVNAALSQLSRTVDKIDTNRVAKAFDTISDTLKDTPSSMRHALSGLSKLSQTISSRDDALHKLLDNTSDVSEIIASRTSQVQKLISDGGSLLGELQRREAAISGLLKGTTALSQQLTGLVKDNEQQLGPALDDLGKVTDILHRNQDHLGNLLSSLAPYIRLFTNTVGNGRWFDGYLCGLLPPVLNVGKLTVNQNGCTPPVAGYDYQRKVQGDH